MTKAELAAIRKLRVRQLIDEQFDGVAAQFAQKIKKAETQVARWFITTGNARNIGEGLAREIERTLDLPAYWLDRKADDARPTGTKGAREQLDLPEHLTEGMARQILSYAAQLSPAQQRHLIASLKEVAESNEITKTVLKIPSLRHPEDAHVAKALKSASILRPGKEHHRRHSRQRKLPLKPKSN